MANRRVSIRDVAAAAGVSPTTASDVLTNAEGARVAKETRQRVRNAAQRLRYTPNIMARGLRLQRTNVLALLSDRIATTPYSGRLILGAQEAALEHGRTLVVLDTGDNPDTERRDVDTLVQQQVDGVLYASVYHRRVQLPAGLDGVPIVLLDARSDNESVPAVVPDEVGGGRAAVEELLAYGHTRIGFATSREDIPATHGRLEGYRAALEAAGIDFNPRLVVAAEYEASGGYLAARTLLTRRTRPTALFCFNDRMAMGAYRAAAELGLRIPDDVSIIGFDDQEIICEGLYPQLTTVALPHFEMGSWAVDALVAQIERPGGQPTGPFPKLVACPLIRRASVAPPAAASPA
jgi:LacI family transcriptional regulator